jgi:hypothetical protein
VAALAGLRKTPLAVGMNSGPGAASVRLALAALLSITAAYQIQRPLTLAATGPLSAFTFRDFSGPESGFRWSGAESTIVVPDPGPGVPVRLEIALSGWRPRGQDPPRVTVSAGGRTVSGQAPGRGEVLTLETTTSGTWRSDLLVHVSSETFRPGPRDARDLGVRVHEVRMQPTGNGVRRPPVRALLGAVATILLVFALLVQVGVTPRTAQALSLVAAALIGGLHAFARPWAALASGPLLLLVAGAALVARLAPKPTRTLTGILADSLGLLVRGGQRLADGRVAAVVVLTLVAVAAAYAATPRLDIDLGSGREVAVARGFGIYDALDGVKFRRLARGASLDLSDFGGGTSWTIQATASIEGAPRQGPILRAAGQELVAPLRDGEWATGSAIVPAPFGWRSGLVLTAASGADALRLDRVVVDRGLAWPSLRVALAVCLSALLVIVAFGSVGLPPWAGLVAATLLAFGAALAMARDPLVAIPFALPFLAIVALATALAALGAAVTGRLAERGLRGVPSPVALAAAAFGFGAWLTATAFPLYRGGHFVFHSSIAEEIWKGRFLIYYLPYPGSMLSEQAHWGSIVVPHPCLYQTLAAPLAALPQPWFYLSEKVFLALMLASVVIVASLLATRTGGDRAGALAAVTAAGLVPTFQLLGLGHLMTLLGVFASSLALAWLALRADRLSERATWWIAVALLTFCFLSYFASLLFTGLVLALLIASLVKEDLKRTRALATATLAASACAFGLYYVNWAWPFLSQSIPRLAGGAVSEPTPILRRLAAEPGKLDYSYGSLAIPLLGLAGLLSLPRSWERRVLIAWGSVLVLVGGADVFFNFILKHHYYVIVPVAVGAGALLSRLWSASRVGRAVALAALGAVLALGLHTAVEVAVGRIP